MEQADADEVDPFDVLGGGDLPTLDEEPLPPPPAPMPVTRAEPQAPPRVTQARLRQAAGYDLPPESFLACVPYAASVWSKRRALRARIQEVAARERVLARALDKQRKGLAEVLAWDPAAEGIAALSSLLGPARNALSSAAKDAEETQSRLHSEAAAHRAAQGAIDEAAREVEPLRNEETRASRALEAAKGELSRAQGALRRAEIELRNAPQAGADADVIASMEATRESRQAEVTLLAGRVKERTAALGLARRELAARVGRQAAAEEEGRKVASPTNTLRTLAATELHPDIVMLTDAALRADMGLVAGGPVSQCTDARKAWRAAQGERELLTEAETSFDMPAFRKGAAVLGAGVLVVVVTMLVAILR